MKSSLSYNELVRKLEQGEVASSYFYYGTEDILIDWAIIRLKKAILAPGSEEFNFSSFRADDDMNWAALGDCLTSLPLLPSRRLVILKRVGKAQSAKGAVSLITQVIKKPEADLTLVLIEPEPDLKKSWYQTLTQYCTCVEFTLPPAAELMKLLHQYVSGYNKVITDEALVRIMMESNPNLRNLLSKLDLLISYVGDQQTIAAPEVEACTVFNREVEVFKYLEALGQRDAAAAHRTLQQLLLRRGETGALIPLLYRQIWALYRMKYLQEKKIPQNQWQEHLNLKPAFLERRYKEYLSRYSRKELGLSLDLLTQADRDRKSSAASETQILWALTDSLLQPHAAEIKLDRI